jgi:hypothetical protein
MCSFNLLGILTYTDSIAKIIEQRIFWHESQLDGRSDRRVGL